MRGFEGLSKRFITFAGQECKDVCKLYEFLSLKIAEDADLLELASHARKGQPVPNLLFGAVHYLLFKGKNHHLQEYYPSLVESPRDKDKSFPAFKDFCLLNKKEIITNLQTKLVQTNEVRRCAYLYPTFCHIYDWVKKPLALIEIGTSAGLQLFWDQYRYSYGTKGMYGNKESSVQITSEIKGNHQPIFHENSPPVFSRVGLDLHINYLSDEDDYLWLRSLIWPNHHDRKELFEKAATYVQKHPVKLIEGDGVELLPEMAKEISEEAVIYVFHTHVANQMPAEVKNKLLYEIEKIGNDRDISHLYNNMKDRDLYLDSYLNGKAHHKKVGQTDGHGSWFTWQLNENFYS